NYYPFGLKHKGYNNNLIGRDHNYGYQGEEETNELGLDVIAYQWRDYDPVIARFNKIDRFSEKYYSISNYVFTSNNPILYHEIAGDSIGAGREHYDRFRQNTVDKRQRILDRRERKLSRARERGNDDRVDSLTERFDSEDADANSDINRLNQTLTELDALENSEQVYNLVTNSPDVVGDKAGNITYDTDTGEVNVNVANGYTSGLFAHELKHAYQFETGALSFGQGGNGGLLYDIQDEVEAYRRGSLFGESSKTIESIRSEYPGLRGRETQRTLNSRVNQFGPLTWEQGFQRLRGTANEQIYIQN
ncbi:RHS repeat-associated core domain-containing protein, partial [Kordia jejudonensis]|uniref:RHS repeat-associated core domain-containing protein n=1 Tax=Kordia jejudonensis TaxID=1348245 RepID=UPI0006297002